MVGNIQKCTSFVCVATVVNYFSLEQLANVLQQRTCAAKINNDLIPSYLDNISNDNAGPRAPHSHKPNVARKWIVFKADVVYTKCIANTGHVHQIIANTRVRYESQMSRRGESG